MALIKTNARSATALDATILTGNIPALNGSAVTNLTSGNLTGALPAISGASLTGITTGKILQVQNMNSSTAVAYDTNTSFVDTGITDSITPSATSSKILIVASIQFTNSSTSDAITWKALRDSTSLGEQQDIRAQGVTLASVYSFAYVDSPSSTSAITYKFQFRRTGGSGYIYVNTSGTSTSSMALLEIGV